jgi:hypothetical protein
VFDIDRMSVAADVAAGLENRDLVLAAQPVSRHHAGNAGADNRDAHAVGSLFVAGITRLTSVIRRAGGATDAPSQREFRQSFLALAGALANRRRHRLQVPDDPEKGHELSACRR